MKGQKLNIKKVLGKCGVFIVILILTACGQDVGPSDKKVNLDVEDKIKASTKGLISISDFVIEKRDVLSEDRVKFHLTLSFKLDENKVEQFKKSERSSIRMFGAMGSNMRPLKMAQQMDGRTEKATWLYRLSGGGVWELSQSNAGHN